MYNRGALSFHVEETLAGGFQFALQFGDALRIERASSAMARFSINGCINQRVGLPIRSSEVSIQSTDDASANANRLPPLDNFCLLLFEVLNLPVERFPVFPSSFQGGIVRRVIVSLPKHH